MSTTPDGVLVDEREREEVLPEDGPGTEGVNSLGKSESYSHGRWFGVIGFSLFSFSLEVRSL